MNKSTVRSAKSVFIVEDHPVFREGLRQIVAREKSLTVCGEAADSVRAFKDIGRLKPDLALVDISLPGQSGLELIRKIRSSNHKIKLLVVSMHDEAVYANRVLRAGGDGYIMKHEDPDEILHAIRDVLSGHLYLSDHVLHHSAKAVFKRTAKPKESPLDQLTDLELEILEKLGWGKSNAEIARAIHCSSRSVVNHCASIRRKLKLPGINALIRYAVCWVENNGK